VLASPPFQALRPYEEKTIRTPPAEARAALAEMGAPLTTDSMGTPTPRRGPMTV